MWVLLMFAAQLSSLAWVAEWLRSRAFTVVIVTAVTALICGVLYLAARRLQMYHLIGAAGGWITYALARAGAVAIMTVIALVFAVVGPVLGAASWLFSTESDAYVDTKRRVDQERARQLQPTGSVPLSSRSDGSLLDLAA